MKKYLFSVIIFCLILSSCIAQRGTVQYSSKNKKAIKLFEDAYKLADKYKNDEAITKLNLAIKTDKDFIEAYQLKSILLIEAKDYTQAESTLTLSLNSKYKDWKDYPETYAYLGDVYVAKQEFGKASQNYTKYVNTKKFKKEEVKKVYERKAYACYITDSLITHPVPFVPVNLGDKINSELSEYHPSLTADGEYLIYTVRTDQSNPNCPSTGNGEENFYFSTMKNNQWNERKSSGSPLNTDCNEGAANLSPDGRFIFFAARNSTDPFGRDGSMDIFYAERIGNSWTQPVPLPSNVNTTAFESQPSFSSDGKTLYFTSDRRDGLGGNDIWKTTKNADGSWTNPENLGREINTYGNEISPFIHPDNQTLYFCSDGRFGVGGQDFYYAKINEKGGFSSVKNIGYPINTIYDERSLVINAEGTKGFFASENLTGKGKYDLYYFELYPEAQPVTTTFLKGHIFDAKTKKSLQANFELYDVETGKLVLTSNSDKMNGEFLISLPKNKKYALNVSLDGYLFHSESFDLKVDDATKPYLLDIALQPIEIGVPIVLKNIFFDTDKFDLKSESTTELNKLVDLMKKNSTLKIEIGGHTDNQGDKNYNQKLSENRAKSVFDYLVKSGISSDRLTYKGYGMTIPIADNGTEDGRKLNRRTEFKVTSK